MQHHNKQLCGSCFDIKHVIASLVLVLELFTLLVVVKKIIKICTCVQEGE